MKSKAPKPRSEAQEQSALIKALKAFEPRHPEIKLIFAIPNGGSRHMLEAVNLKRQGVKAGAPDLFLPVPKSTYENGNISICGGLFIEMKRKPNKLSLEQAEFMLALQAQGYKAEVAWSAEEALKIILDYIGVKQ